MSRNKFFVFMSLAMALVALAWGVDQARAQYVPPPVLVPGVNYNIANFANSPVLTKFVDPLPGVMMPSGAAIAGFYNNGGGQNIPVAVAEPSPVANDTAAYYQIALVEYTAVFHADLAANPTKLRGYVQI